MIEKLGFFCHHHHTQQSKSHAAAAAARRTGKTQVVRHSREIPRKGSDAFHGLGCEMCAHLASYLSIVRNWPLSTVWLCLQANLKVSICPSMISKTGIIENTKYVCLHRARTHDNFVIIRIRVHNVIMEAAVSLQLHPISSLAKELRRREKKVATLDLERSIWLWAARVYETRDENHVPVM